jgi:CheY-like chemotaxis protein
MSHLIQIRCPGCNARIKAPAQLNGQKRKCPGCGELLLIQRKPVEDSEPLLSADESMSSVRNRAGAKAEEKVILLVDDDRELNDGLRSLLEKRGHRVIQAFNGLQAKEVIQQMQPDLMILDMMMPRMGGYPLLEYLHTKTEAPPTIMITAKEGNQHKVYAEYLGVIDYLNKPFAIDHFLKSVEKGLAPQQSDTAENEAE